MLTLKPQLVRPAKSRPKPLQMAAVRATDTGGLGRRHNGKEPACQSGDTSDTGSTPGSGRSPGEANSLSLVVPPG